MPIPIIIGGIIAVSTLYGGKKAYDAYDDNSTANRYNEDARNVYDKASKKLNESKEATNKNFKKLGKLKASIYQESLSDFVDTFSRIKNIDFENKLDIGTNVEVDYDSMLQIRDSVLEIKEVLGGGIVALGSGAAAGFGAYGGVGLLATASTGTAIGGLSGVAATNATLAWLGGGSIAAGGGGMALGTMILGGIIAAPVLAVGSKMLSVKAEEAKQNAYSNYDKAKAAAEEMNIANIVLNEINLRVKEFHSILEPLNIVFEEYIDEMENIVDISHDYSSYTNEKKKIVMIAASIAQTIKNVCDAPIIDEEGAITSKSKRVLKKANKFIQKLEEV